MSTPSIPEARQAAGSLATKLILFVFVSTFVTALVVSWVSIQSTYDSLRGTIDRLYPAELAHAERQMVSWLEASDGELNALAARPEIVAEDPTAAFERAIAGSERFEALARMTPDGGFDVWVGAPPASDAQPLHRRSSRVTLDDGRERGVLWVPLGEGGAGALLGVLDAAHPGAILTRLHRDPHSLLALIDARGAVLAGAGPGPEPGQPVTLPPEQARGGLASEYESGGRAVIGAFRPVRGSADWALVVQTPFEIAFAPVLDVVSRIFVIDLAVILFFSFLAYRITGAVVRPIERLSDWARRIADGQIDLEIPETSDRDEIGLLTRTFNDMMRLLRRNQREIEETNRDLTEKNTRLQQANEVLNQLSITDGLTKLHNHRFFQDHLTREIKRVDRAGEALSMLLIDIDDFKQLNDRFGHAAGDELLMRLAPILNAAIRETDLAARYGGEEFVILAPNTDLSGAYRLAEKVRTSIAESSFILDDSLRPMRVTVSVGVAQFQGNRKRFFQKTDEALYRAKAAGKNCVKVDEDDAEDIEGIT
jgi:diguanylate cyclase (GGDEF)-like protein